MPFGRVGKFKVSTPDRRTCDGIVFHSRSEMLYYQTLKLDAGVKSILRQVPFILGADGHKYVPDFVLTMKDGNQYAVDVKGMETPAFRRHKKMWAKYGPFPLVVVRQKDRAGLKWEQTASIDGGLK